MTKKYLNSENAKQDIAINSKAEKDKVLLLDGTQATSGDLQMGTKKIINLDDGSDSKDAVNYSQLITHITDHKRDYQLAPSFKFYRDFGDKGELMISKTLVIGGHKHLDLYNVGAIEGRNTGFGGEAWSSLKMTKSLARGTYTAVSNFFLLIGDGVF